MTDDNLEKLFQPGATALDDIVAEAIRKDLSRQRGDGHAGALALENVAKVLKVGVATADAALAELEGGDVGAAEDLVVGVHAAADAVRPGVANLNLEEILGRSVDFVEALLSRVGHRLHHGSVGGPGRRGLAGARALGGGLV